MGGFFEDVGDFFGSDVFGFIAGTLAIVGGILTGQLWLVGLGLATIAAALQSRPDHEAIFQNRGSTQASLPVVYGTTKIGAKLVDTRDDPNNETTLHRVLAFCVGSENGQGIEGVGEVFFDEERAITDAVAGNNSLTASNIDDFWAGKLGYSLQLGDDDSVVDVNLNDIWPNAWPETSKGAGIVWMDFAMIREEDPADESKYRGIPNVTAEIQGNRVYDPRDPTGGPDGDGYVFTNNPALCLLDYLASVRYGAARPYGERDVARVGTPQVSTSFSHPEGDTTVNIEAEAGETLAIQIGTRITFEDHPHIYTTETVIELTGPETKAVVLDRGLEAALSGGEAVLPADPSVIDEQSFIDAANYCEDPIPVPRTGGTETQDRFTADVWLDTGDAIARNIAVLESACRGNLVYERGKFRLIIRKAQAPVDFVLTEDNIIGDWNFSRSGAEDTPNQITVRHPDKDRRFTTQEITWPERDDNPYLEEDNGFDNNRDLKLPATTDRLRAEQIGMTMLKEARADKAATLRATEAAMVLSVGDVVPVTHDLPGWEEKEFFVTTMGLRPDATVELALREYDPDAYLIGEQEVPDEVPDPDLPPIPCPDTFPDFDDHLIGYYSDIGGIYCDGNVPVESRHQPNLAPNGAAHAVITKGVGKDYFRQPDGRCPSSSGKLYSSESTTMLGAGNAGDGVAGKEFTNQGESFALMGSFLLTDFPDPNDHHLFGQWGDGVNAGFKVLLSPFDGENELEVRWFNDEVGDSGAKSKALELIDPIPTATRKASSGCPGGNKELVGDEWADIAVVFFDGEALDGNYLVMVVMNQKIQGFLSIGPITKPDYSNVHFVVGGENGLDENSAALSGSFDEIYVFDESISLCQIQNIQADLCGSEVSDFGVSTERDFTTAILEQESITACAFGGGLELKLTLEYTPVIVDPLYEVRIVWYEDGVFQEQQTKTDLFDSNNDPREFTYSKADVGTGPGDEPHTWRADVTLINRNTGNATDTVSAFVDTSQYKTC